ncbi:GSCFA domain-containing protein [Erythrobacter sp. R86502]|uniref:GSCFA domain-containing protein n=1 Tax=Erythrobacter sp. R86502 TaxID=3093846 RepID=UPI0036D34A8F
MATRKYEAITVLGNCQGDQLAACIKRMLPNVTVEFFRYFEDADLLAKTSGPEARLLLVQNPVMSFAPAIETLRQKHDTLDFPAIVHAGFHPDLIRPKTGKALVKGPMGSNHSALILHGFLSGYDEAQTAALFRHDVFEQLGYFRARAESDAHMREQFMKFGLWDERELAPLLAGGCFMHVTLHPKLPVIAMLARLLLAKAGIAPEVRYPENLMADEMASNIVWPVYPEIAEHFGIAGGEYVFQFKPRPQSTFGLSEFIARSFAAYRQIALDRTCHPRLSGQDLLGLEGKLAGTKPSPNPYRSFPDHQFWQRGVLAPGHGVLDPVVEAKFRIGPDTRIGTAGSCFAQHIARRLAASGHNYLVTEAGNGLDAAERSRRNYGVYSARYGNVYTTRQLRQLFERAHGSLMPKDQAWRRPDGRYVDPFRPEIEPDGFASPQLVEESRQEHFAAVRQLFAEVDVLVLTLGLTEAWRSTADGAVFPLCPMVVSSGVDARSYEPVNFTHGEILDDLHAFLTQLRAVNSSVKVLLTVSPVPLVATFENRHVIVSTTASKAILRSVADDVCRNDPSVFYFPSFEIVANPYFEASYFDPADARSVKSEGVDHVMSVFLKHYSALESNVGPTDRSGELDEEQKVVCEEERLDS